MALTNSFSNLEPVHSSMPDSNCCFLTCIQISQAAGKVICYSHFLKNFSVCCNPHKGFSIVNEAEVDVFLEFSCFFYDPTDGSDSKESACNAGDLGLIPGLGKSPREGNGNLLQYSCLDNPMDRGPWQATVHGVAKSQTQLSTVQQQMLAI